jgi:type IV pilus secretin PilQ/predicted competence protein
MLAYQEDGIMNFLFKLVAVAIALLGLTGTAEVPGKIQKIDFTPGKDRALVVVHFQGKGNFRVFQSEKQGNVIVEAGNLVLPASLTKVIDAATSEGPVVQLTPYSAGDGKKSLAKFVIQLKGKAEITSSEMPGKFVLELKRLSLVDESLARKKGIPKFGRSVWNEKDELKSRDAANEKSEETAKKLVDVLNAEPEEKVYFGSRVTFEGTAVDVHDIFRLVGEASSLNIITDSDVKYQSNYSLKDIPWDQLLDIVIQQAQLKAAVTGNVVRIITATKFNSEQEAKLKEIGIADDLEPVVMAVVPLSFAKAEDMKKMIETLLIKRDSSSRAASAPGSAPAAASSTATPSGASGVGGAGAAPQGGGASGKELKFSQDFVRGVIEVDVRSNSLVITNTKESIGRIKKLVNELDVPLPQVLIDSKIIIASETFSRAIGVSWGARATSTGTGRAGILGGFGSSAIELGDEPSPEFSVTPSPGAGALGFSVGAGRHGNLNAQLSLAEADGVSKTVASPRVIVNNKVKANISDGQTQYLQAAGGANASGSFEAVEAKLELTVTPQVTSVGSVLLDVSISKDDIVPGSTTTQNKKIETQVLVDSGATLVLGGVYQFGQSKNQGGIPLLKDLPFLGQLFRTDSSSNSKSELMVFITPQIVDINETQRPAAAQEPASL